MFADTSSNSIVNDNEIYSRNDSFDRAFAAALYGLAEFKI